VDLRRALVLVTFVAACSEKEPAVGTEPRAAPQNDPLAQPTSDGEAFDPGSCDSALADVRKCVADSTLDEAEKLSANATLTQLAELWAMNASLPPPRRQAMCKRVLDGLERLARKTGCPLPSSEP
jgi:hypothetical protein